MFKNTITQIILKAEEKHYLTNGENYVQTVVLPGDANINYWKEITKEEYEQIQKESEVELNV